MPSIYILIYMYYSFSPDNFITYYANFIDEKSEANTYCNKAFFPESILFSNILLY